MAGLLERIHEIVLHEAAAMSRLRRLGLTALRVLYHIGLKSWEDALTQRAAALSFFTVMDLFPILVLLLFGLTRSPIFRDELNRARQVLVDQFVTPASAQMVEDLFQTLGKHMDLLGSGAAGIAALAFLVLVGTTLLVLVEKSVNEIWRAPRLTGSFLSRVAILLVMLTLLPIFVTGFLAVQSRFAPMLSGIFPEGVTRIGFSLFVSTMGFWALFAWVPQARVRALSSLVAAFLTATFWEMAKQGLTLYVHGVFARSLFSKIYGSLYLVPIGLAWIYYSWFLFLFGVQCAYVFQEYPALQSSARQRWLLGKGFVPLSARVALAFLRIVAQKFDRGGGPTLLADLVSELQLHPDEALLWSNALERSGLVVRTGGGALTLAKPADRITLGDVSGLYEETFLKSLGEGGGPLADVPEDGEISASPGRTLAEFVRIPGKLSG